MDGYVGEKAVVERPWQGDLCQFFTREEVARACLRQLDLPRNLLGLRLLEPAAGHGAFLLPLIPRLARSCLSQGLKPDALRPVIHALEIDAIVAASLRQKCADALHDSGIERSAARTLARVWIETGDFLEADIDARFTHIVGNPPYIRWDAVPARLRESYRERFISFKQRADLYIAFIEKSLTLLKPYGQLGFLCPGTWARNVYGGTIREALTTRGHIKGIFDFSDIDSFETPVDAYPHFFVFQNGRAGATKIASMSRQGKCAKATASITRQFAASPSPLVLNLGNDVASTVKRARDAFPTLEHAGCSVRVGSATGSNATFLIDSGTDIVEKSRLLPFVNARSISNGVVKWTGTQIVNVFDSNGKPVRLSRYPRLRRYLLRNKKALKARAKAKKAKIWWRSIDALQPEWYGAPKLLVVDISAVPVIGIDREGYCAGGGVYQIKSREWPLRDLHVFLSAGVLGLFVVGMSSGAANGFHRFQKTQLANIPIPRWKQLDKKWRTRFQTARRSGDLKAILKAVADVYRCHSTTLAKYVVRDWKTFLAPRKAKRQT
jgi:hypothetical protein